MVDMVVDERPWKRSAGNNQKIEFLVFGELIDTTNIADLSLSHFVRDIDDASLLDKK